jgi:TRAP-type mannitol/chloroaromatic compound transport system permease small subunit
MTATTFLIVILRYVFDLGWVWMQESVIYAHAINFCVAGAFTWARDGHVRIDLFYGKMSDSRKALIDMMGTFFFVWPMMGLILFEAYPYVRDSWSVLESSGESGGLPAVFVLKSFVLVYAGLFILQSFLLLPNWIQKLRTHRS